MKRYITNLEKPVSIITMDGQRFEDVTKIGSLVSPIFEGIEIWNGNVKIHIAKGLGYTLLGNSES